MGTLSYHHQSLVESLYGHFGKYIFSSFAVEMTSRKALDDYINTVEDTTKLIEFIDRVAPLIYTNLHCCHCGAYLSIEEEEMIESEFECPTFFETGLEHAEECPTLARIPIFVLCDECKNLRESYLAETTERALIQAYMSRHCPLCAVPCRMKGNFDFGSIENLLVKGVKPIFSISLKLYKPWKNPIFETSNCMVWDDEAMIYNIWRSRHTCAHPINGNYKSGYKTVAEQGSLIGLFESKKGGVFDILLTRCEDGLWFYEPYCYLTGTYDDIYTLKSDSLEEFDEIAKELSEKYSIRILSWKEISKVWGGPIRYNEYIYSDYKGREVKEYVIEKELPYITETIRGVRYIIFRDENAVSRDIIYRELQIPWGSKYTEICNTAFMQKTDIPNIIFKIEYNNRIIVKAINPEDKALQTLAENCFLPIFVACSYRDEYCFNEVYVSLGILESLAVAVVRSLKLCLEFMKIYPATFNQKLIEVFKAAKFGRIVIQGIIFKTEYNSSFVDDLFYDLEENMLKDEGVEFLEILTGVYPKFEELLEDLRQRID